jgi:predicted enzyme related to lactoylglutathione lyase
MAHIEQNPPGSFTWIELASPDQSASKQFYHPLFGWDTAEFPMGPEAIYAIFRLDGRDVGGCYAIDAQMKAQGVPPHWMIYIAVASADEAAAKAADAGGKVVVAPFDVNDFGRMAVLQDPTGAMFSIWQEKLNKGIGIAGVPGSLCWADLSTPDQETAAAFYRKLFGWEVSAGEHDTSGYLHIKNGEQFIGGIPPSAHRNPNAPPHWMLYFLVDDCDASAAKSKELGANIYMGPMTMEGVGRMAIVADPQGAVFALFQPMRKG